MFQVSALCCAGGEENLIMLDRSVHRANAAGTVGWAGSTFGPMHKSRLGEHEFEALMRTLDNLVRDCVFYYYYYYYWAYHLSSTSAPPYRALTIL